MDDDGITSRLGQDLEGALCPGMVVPPALEKMYRWIEANGCVDEYGLGHLFPEREMRESETPDRRIGGTDITFRAEGNPNLEYWFGRSDEAFDRQLCVFARTGHDGSMAALWLTDDGEQKIVHLGSGSGSTTVCVLADDPVDFLRLLAIGYDEICWGKELSKPPNSGDDCFIEPNHAFVKWVTDTFGVDIPQCGLDIIKHHSNMGDDDSEDPFWRWADKHSG